MKNIIFVHGTGVREKSYTESLLTISARLDREDISVVGCRWYEDGGVELNKGGISIPDFDSTRSVSEVSEDDRAVSTWAVLYEDPLCELRLLGLTQQQSGNAAPNQVMGSQQLDAWLRGLSIEGDLAEQLEKCSLTAVWAEAVRKVTTSDEFRLAFQRPMTVTARIRRTLAEAVVAQALALHRALYQETADWIDGANRDHLVDLLVGDQDRDVKGWALKNLLARPFTRYAQRQRGKISEDAFGAIGDILFYQARGEAIRSFIKNKIELFESDVVLLAHSLGGIACVDLLILHALPQVELLITVGSQAPVLYEMNALVSKPFEVNKETPLPEHFPRRWLNIYDPRDFLSYVARGVFHGPSITDERVDNGQPFPQAHTSYWKNDKVWETIYKELA
ncbi:MAG: hypothetical protein L0226_00900 [Acidobacteria bacterium]|nr:hypothetical protein [Acidobacteriota bacterium]MCI0659777.1 hypothetical protein [Acidobacteriota bacterium]